MCDPCMQNTEEIIAKHVVYSNQRIPIQKCSSLRKDAEYAETNEKSIYDFLFFESWSFLYSKCGKFSMNFTYNSKNKNRKCILFRFSLNSAPLINI